MKPDYENYMRLALNFAKRGIGKVSPNPLVGCIIVKNGKIVGKGFHKLFGKEHAEIHALNKIENKANGATMFVNLEPCVHYGKTPPCVEAIIKAGIKEVIAAIKDPNPLVNGKGFKCLKNEGIRVKTGILSTEARKLNEVYIKYITKKIPFVILKTALSLDGKVATRTGESRWISNEFSRRYVHKLRSHADAILVGINTILKDNPELTVRNRPKRDYVKTPIRVIVDTKLRIPLDAKVLNNDAPTIIATTRFASLIKMRVLKNRGINVLVIRHKDGKIILKDLMKNLAKLNIASVLVEGGGYINAGLLEEKLVDKIMFFICPKIIGGDTALTPVEGRGVDRINKAIKIKDIHIRRFGEDILVEGYVQ